MQVPSSSSSHAYPVSSSPTSKPAPLDVHEIEEGNDSPHSLANCFFMCTSPLSARDRTLSPTLSLMDERKVEDITTTSINLIDIPFERYCHDTKNDIQFISDDPSQPDVEAPVRMLINDSNSPAINLKILILVDEGTALFCHLKALEGGKNVENVRTIDTANTDEDVKTTDVIDSSGISVETDLIALKKSHLKTLTLLSTLLDDILTEIGEDNIEASDKQNCDAFKIQLDFAKSRTAQANIQVAHTMKQIISSCNFTKVKKETQPADVSTASSLSSRDKKLPMIIRNVAEALDDIFISPNRTPNEQCVYGSGIVTNLLSNCCFYAKTRVTQDADWIPKSLGDTHGIVRIVIGDDGEGFKLDKPYPTREDYNNEDYNNAAKIKFVAEGEKGSQSKGSGYGGANVNFYVKQLGGDFTINTGPSGTTFFVMFPCVKMNKERTLSPSISASPPVPSVSLQLISIEEKKASIIAEAPFAIVVDDNGINLKAAGKAIGSVFDLKPLATSSCVASPVGRFSMRRSFSSLSLGSSLSLDSGMDCKRMSLSSLSEIPLASADVPESGEETKIPERINLFDLQNRDVFEKDIISIREIIGYAIQNQRPVYILMDFELGKCQFNGDQLAKDIGLRLCGSSDPEVIAQYFKANKIFVYKVSATAVAADKATRREHLPLYYTDAVSKPLGSIILTKHFYAASHPEDLDEF